MIRKLKDFTKAYGHERENTLKYFNALTDASLDQAVADGHWTLGQLAWHITVTIPEMMGKVGIKVKSLNHEAPRPAVAAKIVAAYDAVTAELLTKVKKKWDDSTLKIEDDLYGEQWKRGTTLQILIGHEVHHRGQMSVVMRQAGLAVPGLYGPSKEEWKAYGVEPPQF